MARFKQDKFGKINLNLYEFIKFEVIKNFPTEVFVIGLTYKVDKNNKTKNLRVVFAT